MILTGYKLVSKFLHHAETALHIWLPPRLSAISCFLPKLLSAQNGFLPGLFDSASCRESRREAESHGQTWQEVIYHVQKSRQEARGRGQSRRKPSITDCLGRERKFADYFILCDSAPSGRI